MSTENVVSRPHRAVPAVLFLVVLSVLGIGFGLYRRAQANTSAPPLAAQPKPVTAIEAQAAQYRAHRRYVATLEPWMRAKVGPQLVSAYVDTVLFRPGTAVKKGDVLATLDCRDASAAAQATMMAARALEAKQVAIAKEADRMNKMLDGGFVSANEAEKKKAESDAESAQVLAAKAKLAGSSLEVADCILKAPFDGEVDARWMDPGAFAKPGIPILSVIDRGTLRIAADVPETDFTWVAPGTPVELSVLATGAKITAKIARRAPSADPGTRTVRVEIDLVDATRSIPAGTTAELTIEVGEPKPAAKIPLIAAAVRGDRAAVFVVDNGVAKKKSVPVLGEAGDSLFVDPALVGAHLVTEGRGLLGDGDAVKTGEKTAVVP